MKPRFPDHGEEPADASGVRSPLSSAHAAGDGRGRLGPEQRLVNLPVEFDASRRAREQLKLTGLITPAEDQVVGKVLGAAAMTYVAATLTSILQLLFFVIRARGFRRRQDGTSV